MRLDNQEFNFNFIESGENIIRCSNVEEAFFNIFNITLDENTSFIKPAEKYIDGHPIIRLNVEYGGEQYQDVEFKVVAADGDKPCVFLNESTLENGCIFEPKEPEIETLEDQIELLAETIEATVELEESAPDVDWHQLKQTSREIHENKIAALIKQVEQQLSVRIDESLHSARQSILAESINIQSKTQNDIGAKVDESIDDLNALIEQWEHAAEAKISNYIIHAIDETRIAIEEQFEVVVQEQQQDSLEVLSEKIGIIAIESKQAIFDELQSIIEQQSNLLQQTVASADETIKEHIAAKLNEFNQSIIEKNTESFDAGIVGFINTQTEWLQQFVEGKIADVKQTLDAAQVALEQKQDALAQKLTEHASAIVADASCKIVEQSKTLHQEQLQNVRQCVDEVISEQIAALQPTTEIIVTEARNTQKNLFKDAIGSIKTELSSEMQAHVANLQQDVYKKFAIYAQSYAGGGSVAVQYANGGTMNGSLNVATGQILSGGIDISTLFGGGGGGSADRLVNGSYQVILSGDGNLTFPGGGYIGSQYGAPGWIVTPPDQGGIASADGQQYIQINNNQGIFIGTSWPLSAYEWTFGRDGGLKFPDGTVQTTAFLNNLSAYATVNYLNSNFLKLSGGTVTGVLSTTNVIYASGGNSNQWNSTYSIVQSNSASWGGGGGLTIFSEVSSATSPNNTIPTFGLSARSLSADVDFAIIPKGSGALLTQMPDGSASGGNKRGLYATDWQRVRDEAFQVASGIYSTIGGGYGNTASGINATVAGGAANAASGGDTVIGGGFVNTASGDWTTIGGGKNNVASGNVSTIGGGDGNISSGDAATIGGGYALSAIGSYSTIGGGIGNIASGENSTIAGGDSNITSGPNSTVGGGGYNTAVNVYSTVGGGISNNASGQYSAIGGGVSNVASGFVSTIGGGTGNNASGQYSAIGGGSSNITSGANSFIACGDSNNTNSQDNTFILGSNITASLPNYTYVNNLSSQGDIIAPSFILSSPSNFRYRVTVSDAGELTTTLI